MAWVDNATPEVDRESQYPMIIAICATLSALSVAIVSTRLWIRFKNHGLAADDWMATLSMVFAFLYSILCIVQTKYGLGLPLQKRPVANLVPYTRSNFAGRPIYQLGISFFKVALLISYLRLFKGTHHVLYRRIVWIAIVFVLAGHLGCALTLILACRPVHKSWNPKTPGSCIASGPSFTAYAIVTIISDVVVAVIPIPVLVQLKVSTGRKVGLTIDRIQHGDGNSTMLILWGVTEFNVGNIVSSLPFLAPVFLRKARQYTSKYPQGSGSGYVSDRGDLKRGRPNESYMLSSLSSRHKGGFSSAKATSHETSSQENILKTGNTGSIVKSMAYSVQVTG
ncbi:hypothetical protein GE09DRAFT_1258232 [Coniochaeta sp. 2T2.1]|nr:hypothetical protein GE09DRAFT_1258232 [Coniochaeta sp. 2T2.1]